MVKRPHIRSLIISEYAANVMALNKLWPGWFSNGLVRRAYEGAAVNRFLKRKKSPEIFVRIEDGRLVPGRWRYGNINGEADYRGFRYRAGDDRILYENSNRSFHYKELARGLVRMAIVSDWLPEILCAAIAGKPLNDVVEDKGFFIHKLNPVIRRARNGRHRGRRGVILTLQVAFGSEFWEQACPT